VIIFYFKTIKNINFVEEAVHKYGSQCIVVSIDYKINKENQKEIFINSGKTPTGIVLEDFIEKINKNFFLIFFN
jgi:cyclase